MQISIFGKTDKRTCIYTLMKILQPMGDVAIVTSNPCYCRLTEDGAPFGFYQNVAIFVTDASADEMWAVVDRSPDDFEFIILDNLYNEATDLILYIQGAGPEELDEYLFDTFDDMPVITMGKSKSKLSVPYASDLMVKLEAIEYYKQLRIPSPQMLNILAELLKDKLHMSTKDIVKVASRK